MIRRKLYKTKLCTLFQRDRFCNFAHGEAEIRRFGGSFNGNRSRKKKKLFDTKKILWDASPRHLLGKDLKNNRKRETRVERRNRKKQHMNRESDVSESSEASDGPEDRKREEKASSYDDKDGLEEQIRQILLDIEMLDDHKSQLEIFLDEKADEAYKLFSQIEELESQINKEQENCRRITSKIKKFIKAHGWYIKAQEELRRSQTHLQKIGYQLSSDTLRTYANEDDPSINVTSDGDPNDGGKSKKYDHMSNMSSIKKRS
ncbi:unnamed protein product, partial [Musa hybrid cultivar]